MSVFPCMVRVALIVFLIYIEGETLYSCNDIYCKESIPLFAHAGARKAAGAGYAHRETGKAVT